MEMSTGDATASAPALASAAPRPRSPPAYPDLCGRHRLQVEVQLLNREIGVLQYELAVVVHRELTTPQARRPLGFHKTQRPCTCNKDELQSVEALQSVSSCCKEVHEYVGTNPDPLIPVTKKRDKSCCLRRCLRTLLCFNFSWVCCSAGGCPQCTKRPSCACRHSDCRCCRCKWGCPCSDICKFSCSCCRSCCSFPKISCPEYSCGCVWSCSKCTEVCLCTKHTCCKSQCLCQWT